jgi:hypothetical protein
MAAVMPAAVGLEGTLEAVWVLLHNTPGPGASPLVAEQWHHDVDQLVVAVINTPLHGGWRANHSHGTPDPP